MWLTCSSFARMSIHVCRLLVLHAFVGELWIFLHTKFSGWENKMQEVQWSVIWKNEISIT